MTALVWDKSGERFFEAGCDRGVYYPQSGAGVAWNGLVSVKESVVGGSVTPYYIDGVKHLDVLENEDFQATLTAYSAPKEFIEADGLRGIGAGLYATNQPRQTFGLSYRTRLGNDETSTEYGYVLHFVYNATASPVEKTYNTLSAETTPSTFDWDISAVPVYGTGFKPTSHFELRSDEISIYHLQYIEGVLYGGDIAAPRLPSIADIILYTEITDGLTEFIEEPI